MLQTKSNLIAKTLHNLGSRTHIGRVKMEKNIGKTKKEISASNNKNLYGKRKDFFDMFMGN